jgi:hypothetical protein
MRLHGTHAPNKLNQMQRSGVAENPEITDWVENGGKNGCRVFVRSAILLVGPMCAPERFTARKHYIWTPMKTVKTIGREQYPIERGITFR